MVRHSQFFRGKFPQLILLRLFGVFIVGIVLSAIIALLITLSLPAVEDLTDTQLKVPMSVYTADGQLIAEFGEEKRILGHINEVPALLVKAVLAAEDHSLVGVDARHFARECILHTLIHREARRVARHWHALGSSEMREDEHHERGIGQARECSADFVVYVAHVAVQIRFART